MLKKKEVILMSENKEKGFSNTVINWFPGHMAKTKRQINEQLNLVDIVYEVIDARMPISSKIVDIDELLANKPKILVVTKYDLCDKKETDIILDWYKNNGYYVVALDLMNGKLESLINFTNQLMEDINNKRVQKGLKERVARVLIVGAPNVGKSTLINRLVGKNSAGVANTPGFTKSLSWIRVNNKIELLDTPGILWPKMSDQEVAKTLAAFSAIKEEILNKDQISSFILEKMFQYYPEKLEERYGITSVDDIAEVYEAIGKRRGALSKGGIVDYDKVSDIIMRDFKNGLFGKITFDRLS